MMIQLYEASLMIQQWHQSLVQLDGGREKYVVVCQMRVKVYVGW